MMPMRVAVVGVGHLGQHHARVLAGLPEVQLVGVADSRIEQARLVAGRHGTEAFADYRDSDRSRRRRLDRRPHGACTARWPAPSCRAGSRRWSRSRSPRRSPRPRNWSRLARARGVTLQVGHIERFNPALSALEGLSLRPKYIAAERLSTHTFRSTDIGVVLDLMIHDLDLVGSLVADAGPVGGGGRG
jgi:predicted dehydrogenase